jgi:hypothetical protein
MYLTVRRKVSVQEIGENPKADRTDGYNASYEFSTTYALLGYCTIVSMLIS